MKLINRSAFAVLPKAPFVEWANQQQDELNQSMTLEEHRAEGNVYLVDEYDDEADIQRQLSAHFEAIFTNELAAWDEFGDHWPAPLTLELFLAWFDVQPQVMALDLSAQLLLMAALDE